MWWRSGNLILLVWLALPLAATEPTKPPNLQIPPSRPQLTQKAGYIFSGTVKAIDRLTPKANSVAVMQITFHVDQGMRGARTGQTLVIREWSGLWQGEARHRVGERVMLFLYPPSKLGLTSPVGGASGRFEIDTRGRVIIEPHRVSLKRTELPENLRIAPGELLQRLKRAEENR